MEGDALDLFVGEMLKMMMTFGTTISPDKVREVSAVIREHGFAKPEDLASDEFADVVRGRSLRSDVFAGFYQDAFLGEATKRFSTLPDQGCGRCRGKMIACSFNGCKTCERCGLNYRSCRECAAESLRKGCTPGQCAWCPKLLGEHQRVSERCEGISYCGPVCQGLCDEDLAERASPGDLS